MIKILFVGIVLILSLIFADIRDVAAVNITLAWDANTETNLAGYRLFCRESGEEYSYEYPDWDGVETEGTIYNLANGIIYYFVARAYNTEGFESKDSNEVRYDGSIKSEGDDSGNGCFINTLIK